MKAVKKAVCLAICALLLVSVCGCGQEVRREGEQNETPSMFVLVEETLSWRVVYHRDTKVMYAISYGGYNSGNFTLLVNPDGSPMIWDK